MSRYEVRLSDRALKELRRLSTEARDRPMPALDDLETDPKPPTARRLFGQDGTRICKGDYRVLYVVDDELLQVSVYRIGHRRDVYRKR